MINKLEYGIELVQGEIKIRYEYEQCDILFVETQDEDGVEEFRKGKTYAEIIYEYVGDNQESREFIMEIAKYRYETMYK